MTSQTTTKVNSELVGSQLSQTELCIIHQKRFHRFLNIYMHRFLSDYHNNSFFLLSRKRTDTSLFFQTLLESRQPFAITRSYTAELQPVLFETYPEFLKEAELMEPNDTSE